MNLCSTPESAKWRANAVADQAPSAFAFPGSSSTHQNDVNQTSRSSSGATAFAGAGVEQLERRADDVRRDPEPDHDAVGDSPGEAERARRVGAHDDRDAARAGPGQRQGVTVPVCAARLEETANGEDVGLELGELRGAQAEMPDACAARADADVHAAGREVVDGRRARRRDNG